MVSRRDETVTTKNEEILNNDYLKERDFIEKLFSIEFKSNVKKKNENVGEGNVYIELNELFTKEETCKKETSRKKYEKKEKERKKLMNKGSSLFSKLSSKRFLNCLSFFRNLFIKRHTR